VGGPHEEGLCGFVKLEDRASVGAGQLYGMRDDRLKHMVEVEAGADGLGDLSQSFQLFDLLGQLRLAGFEGATEIHLTDGDGRLGGEGGEHVGLVITERVDLRTPYQQDSDELVVEQHGYAEDGAQSGEALELEAAVVRIVEDVGDLLGPYSATRPMSEPRSGPTRFAAMKATPSLERPVERASRRKSPSTR